MGDHQERKMGMGMPPLGFTSVVLPQNSSPKLPSLSGANHGGFTGTSTLQIPNQNLHYSHTQMRDRRGDSDSDESESDPDLDPATLLNTRTSTASYFKTLSQPQPPSVSPQVESSTMGVRYRECQKNHAAALGCHVVDGCGEFMPNGEEGTPDAFKCAACNCHRNFHRREVEGEQNHLPGPNSHPPQYNDNGKISTPALTLGGRHQNQLQVPTPVPPPRQLAQRFPPLMMAFGGGGNGAPAESSSEHLDVPQGTTTGEGTHPSSSKKRFRTKFSQEQKDKMQEFGERLGWKIQKQDEQQVQEFCAQVGVKRQVFKVWMHNSKQALKKKQL